MRKCCICGEEKELTEFYKNKPSADGYLKHCKKCHDEKIRLYSENNKEKVKLRDHLKYEKNSDKVKKRSTIWKKVNREAYLFSHKNTNFRRRNATGKITKKEWRELLEKYNHSCLCCGRNDVEMTIDHVIPIAIGGSNTIDNIQPLCMKCNAKKHTTIMDYR